MSHPGKLKTMAPIETHGQTAFTAVVCTYRRPRQLGACLRSLLAQEIPPQEILVVDNAPDDGRTRKLLERDFPFCRYAAEPRAGVAAARNRGLLEARAPVIVFIDDDCIATRGWLKGMARAFRSNPRLGCCTGPVLPLELRTPAQRLMEKRGGYSKGLSRRSYTRESGNGSATYPVQAWLFGTGANMACRRSVFEAIGGFDESLGCAEDLDMLFRVVRAGFELLYEPDARVLHRHHERRQALRRALFYWGWGYVAFLKKIARQDPVYRPKALQELKGWLISFQLKQRVGGKLMARGLAEFPLDLILAEFAGSVAALAISRPGRRRGLRGTGWQKEPRSGSRGISGA